MLLYNKGGKITGLLRDSEQIPEVQNGVKITYDRWKIVAGSTQIISPAVRQLCSARRWPHRKGWAALAALQRRGEKTSSGTEQQRSPVLRSHEWITAAVPTKKRAPTTQTNKNKTKMSRRIQIMNGLGARTDRAIINEHIIWGTAY